MLRVGLSPDGDITFGIKIVPPEVKKGISFISCYTRVGGIKRSVPLNQMKGRYSLSGKFEKIPSTLRAFILSMSSESFTVQT